MISAPALETPAEPLALLLKMVEDGKLAVTSISIAAITKSYLDELRLLTNIDAEQMSEFVQLGCRLLYIKSLAILPQGDPEEQESEIAKLNYEIEEYRFYQTIAKTLASKRPHRHWRRQGVTKLGPAELPTPNISLDKLQKAFSEAVKRADPLPQKANLVPHISQASVEKAILTKLHSGAYSLAILIESAKNRVEIIVTFLAILELIKQQRIKITQASQFQPIMIEAYGE